MSQPLAATIQRNGDDAIELRVGAWTLTLLVDPVTGKVTSTVRGEAYAGRLDGLLWDEWETLLEVTASEPLTVRA